MENFIVSARKYRPATFRTVVGQSAITSTLKNAIKNNHLAHAYLFCGPRGVGKTTCARIFAKTINCLNITSEMEACDTCESCTAFNTSRSYNIHELDAASNNTVDEIRNLIDQVRIPPQVGKYSLYIIDEVHMLSTAAFNAFLKTLEEPPAHAIFILATTEKHKIIPTILSRCQIFDFNRIKNDDIVEHLTYVAKQENIMFDVDGLAVIAQKADGAMRDALSIFDQIVSFAGTNVTYQDVINNLNVLDYDYYFRLTRAFLDNNYTSCLLIFNEILENGFDAYFFISGLSDHLRNLLVGRKEETFGLLELGANIREQYKQIAKECSTDMLIKALNIVNSSELQYKSAQNKRLHIELCLLNLASITQNPIATPVSSANPNPVNTTPTPPTPITSKPVSTSTVTTSSTASKPIETQPPRLGSMPSIKSTLQGQSQVTPNSSKTTSVSNTPIKQDNNSPFTLEALQVEWNNFANTHKDNTRIYSTLTSRQPIIEDTTRVVFEIDNALQIDTLNEYKTPLLNHLRSVLNSNITIETRISENAPQEKKVYTDNDKLNYMIEKNPLLLTLKKELNLDFDTETK